MRGRLAFVMPAWALVASCSDPDTYPWEKSGRPPEQTAAPRITEPSGSGSLQTLPEESRAPRGGIYEQCWHGLSAGKDPVRDVTRLATVCGPSTGMEAVGDGLVEGAIAEGTPVIFDLPLQKNRCYRIFAASDPSVPELDVEVHSSRGTLIASDHQEGRLAIAQPDRPFCSFADDAATILVTARSGKGAFSLEVLSVAAPTSH